MSLERSDPFGSHILSDRSCLLWTLPRLDPSGTWDCICILNLPHRRRWPFNRFKTDQLSKEVVRLPILWSATPSRLNPEYQPYWELHPSSGLVCASLYFHLGLFGLVVIKSGRAVLRYLGHSLEDREGSCTESLGQRSRPRSGHRLQCWEEVETTGYGWYWEVA